MNAITQLAAFEQEPDGDTPDIISWAQRQMINHGVTPNRANIMAMAAADLVEAGAIVIVEVRMRGAHLTITDRPISDEPYITITRYGRHAATRKLESFMNEQVPSRATPAE